MFSKNSPNSLVIVFRTLVFVIGRTKSDSIAVSAVKRAESRHIPQHLPDSSAESATDGHFGAISAHSIADSAIKALR
ncbi:hypothetical protein NYE80_29765 [Paenibacillus sp. FSL H7-0357]|uniref:hypothetical protein n=1 Tax=Paenibacillus sp. FSL H7-0357 TaxID=1536774 RepID=UPI0030D1184F